MNVPLSYPIPEASKASGVGRTTIYEEIKAGRLRAVKRGRRTLILAEDLKAWLSTLPTIERLRDSTSTPNRTPRG